MRKIAIIFMGIVLISSIISCRSNDKIESPPAAQVGDELITIKDVETFKQNRADSLTDIQALNILIERDLLYQEAQKQGISMSLQEAKEYAKEQRKIIESSEEGKKVIDDYVKKLGISYEQYWSDNAPRGYMRSLSENKMKDSISDKIREEILRNYPNLKDEEVQKYFDQLYQKKIDELKSKYNVKYFIN